MDAEPKPYRPRCMFLTFKALQVYGEDYQDDPDFQSGAMEFICCKTFEPYGPDGCAAALDMCTEPARTCFREF